MQIKIFTTGRDVRCPNCLFENVRSVCVFQGKATPLAKKDHEEMDVEDGEVVENGEDGENGEADLDLMVRVTVSRMRNRFSERSSSERNFGLEETFRTQHKNWLRS